MQKKIIIIAGPNGAGKTTFARSFLPQEAQCHRFINADLIAAGLSPFAPDRAAFKAGRLMLEEIDDCIEREQSFAFETTLAGLTYVGRIRKWQELGYHVSLFFLLLPSPEVAIARVSERVQQEDMTFLSRLFAAASMLECVTLRQPTNILWTAERSLIT